MTDLHWLTATEVRELYARKELSPVELMDAVLDRLEATEPALNAFVTITAEQARDQAVQAERRMANTPFDELPPLTGLPITVKDLIDTAGVRTTYGTVTFSDHVPGHDSADWARLKAAGAILVGKTTTPEFGMLGVTDSRLTGVTNNPWNLAKTAGGSSGGAAASVAAGVAPLAWGNDGGGSIRVPASCCGTVGLKPSAGRIPSSEAAYDGVSSSGPLTRSVADAALLLSVTAGPHPGDPLSLPAADPRLFLDAVGHPDLTGARIAAATHFGLGPIAADVERTFREALDRLRDLGAVVTEVEMQLPDPIDYFLAFWSPSAADFVDQLRAQAGWDDGLLHPIMLEIADHARGMSAIDYWRTATETRSKIAAGFNAALNGRDLLVTPTMPLVAFDHPGALAGNADVDGQPVRRPALDFHRLTEPPSHAGLPALTLPCGFSSGLPVGLQFIGAAHADAQVLRMAAAYEAATPWHTRHPHI